MKNEEVEKESRAIPVSIMGTVLEGLAAEQPMFTQIGIGHCMPEKVDGAADTVADNVAQVHLPVSIPEDPSRTTLTMHQPQMQTVQEQAVPQCNVGSGSQEAAQRLTGTAHN